MLRIPPDSTDPGAAAAVAALAVLIPLSVGACGPSPPPCGGSPDAGLAFARVASGPPVARARSSPAAAWLDVERDGDPDLYVLNGYGSLDEEPVPQENGLYLNDGAGRFRAASSHPLVRDVTFSGSAVWGDVDGDGRSDLFVANQRGADNFLFLGEGGGSYRRVTGRPPTTDGGRSFSASLVDIDGDGLLDLHVLNGRDGDGGEADFLYRNRGGGRFAPVEDVPFVREALPSGGAAWADYDDDGDPDLFLPVYAAAEPHRLYRNDGEWSFTEVLEASGLSPEPFSFWPPASVAHWVDYDADGDLDLFVGNTRGAVDFLFANDGSGRFSRVTAGRVGLDATYVSDALWADLDSDADLDLVVAAWGGAPEIYVSDGRGELRPADVAGFGDAVTFASSVSAADVEGDGDLDLYLTQWPINEAGGAPNELYRNVGESGNWLALELEGTDSNRSGIGAVVTVSAEIDGAVRQQVRHVSARTSWRSTGGLALHVGLGDAGSVRRIEVAWPSGRTDVLPGPIPVNRKMTIREGGTVR